MNQASPIEFLVIQEILRRRLEYQENRLYKTILMEPKQ
ncbi:hypothetical protein LEP1GSC034_0220 [Leptospira interrogans str. 2003000735]|uniref:Uncharacterized protein n=1 Tax=Leptospira interrogans str. 2002000626 TaxID=996803 RepID=A0A829DA74_LEPIR|nr:hypothetical protein LEP1GSC027_4177 [Leptospira interrogans str. 2002000624]EKQ36909.1 hypothetical protein LEP1GSC025_0789 [Leptospira interrogans str. 2002000621]EKQ49812.1 hypothetical protein LEP1GSC026_4697 [Leptospira interrogans str. 2002000623]EMJ75259.1 hypothetical protein LEP1GSC034_0220 [Leptospira interrogans str. 2003000735]EMJ75673.1 hypothetical protein LEP1GSC033_0077 [Leptospira interrogans str. 2002000632]EMJ76780.1 hypothetical protein LEP1GSC032_4721 [Leptospira interr